MKQFHGFGKKGRYMLSTDSAALKQHDGVGKARFSIVTAAIGFEAKPPKSDLETARDIRDAVDEAVKARVDAALLLEGDDARAAVHAAIVRGRRKAREEAKEAAQKAAKFDRRSKERAPSTIARAIDAALDRGCQTAREVFDCLRKDPVVVSIEGDDPVRSFVWRDDRSREQEMKYHSFESLVTKRKKRRRQK